MNYAEFDEYRTNLLNEAGELMYCKGEEYANSTDRFGNFRRLSTTLGIPDYQVAWVLTAKHLDAISSYMRLGHSSSTESFRGRIIDAINYLTFIGGMVTEKENREDAEMQAAMDTRKDVGVAWQEAVDKISSRLLVPNVDADRPMGFDESGMRGAVGTPDARQMEFKFDLSQSERDRAERELADEKFRHAVRCEIEQNATIRRGRQSTMPYVQGIGKR